MAYLGKQPEQDITDKVVAIIAELKSIEIGSMESIEVLGYYTKGDGGGGTFYWDSTSTEADNGGTIIQATGVSTGRWKRPLDGMINNIQKWGAVDDDDGSLTTTNSMIAFSKCFQYLNSIGGGIIYLPKTKTGGYFINGDDNTPITSNIEIVADYGVYLRIIYSGGINNSPFSNNSKLKYNRETLKIMHNFGFKAYGDKNITPRPSENLNSITQSQGVFSLPRLLSGNDFKVIDFADKNTEVAPINVSADSISFNANSKQIGACKYSIIGEEVFGLLSAAAGGDFLVGVLTVNGYSHFTQNSGSQVVELIEWDTDYPQIDLGVPYSLLDQQRDLFNNALLSVKVLSSNTYSVLVNGLVIGTHTTHSPILSVTFGCKNINDTVNFSQMSSVYGNSKGGSKPLRIIACGDSTGDNDVQYSQFRIMASILQSAGIQLAELNNIATSGETSGQQLIKLKTIGVGYDYCTIQIGINDIQGIVSFSTFVQNIVDMINHCKSIGTIPIVGIPTSFYSLAEANTNGQIGGQNTSNNQSGHIYRALIIRAIASAGGIVNLQTYKNYGAMTAKWLSLDEDGLNIDSIVTDNIHPTPYGSKQLGLGWAESILGAMHRCDLSIKESVVSVPTSWMQNGFGTTSRPKIKGSKLFGTVYFDGATNADGNPFMKLPPFFRVLNVVMLTTVAISAGGLPLGTASVYIGTDGNIYAFGLPNGTKSIELGEIDLLEFLVK